MLFRSEQTDSRSAYRGPCRGMLCFRPRTFACNHQLSGNRVLLLENRASIFKRALTNSRQIPQPAVMKGPRPHRHCFNGFQQFDYCQRCEPPAIRKRLSRPTGRRMERVALGSFSIDEVIWRHVRCDAPGDGLVFARCGSLNGGPAGAKPNQGAGQRRQQEYGAERDGQKQRAF